MFTPAEGFQVPPAGPSRRHVALVAYAGADMVARPRRVWCQAPGDITIRDEVGTELLYSGVVGTVLEIAPVRIMALTGTWYGLL